MSNSDSVFVMYHGDVKTLHLIARRKNGDPVDLTGVTEIVVSFDPLSGQPVVDRKFSISGQVVVDNAADGKFSIPIDATVSPTINPADLQDVQVVLTLPSEGPVTILYSKIFSMKKRKGES